MCGEGFVRAPIGPALRDARVDRPAFVGDSGTEDDESRFTVEVRIGDATLGRGTGRSKRRAERAAAADALERRAQRDG